MQIGQTEPKVYIDTPQASVCSKQKEYLKRKAERVFNTDNPSVKPDGLPAPFTQGSLVKILFLRYALFLHS